MVPETVTGSDATATTARRRDGNPVGAAPSTQCTVHPDGIDTSAVEIAPDSRLMSSVMSTATRTSPAAAVSENGIEPAPSVGANVDELTKATTQPP